MTWLNVKTELSNRRNLAPLRVVFNRGIDL